MPTQQEQLYLKTINDLEKRIADQDPYEILGSSAIIRKLFLDDHPLVDQINRECKFKLQFNVCLPTPLPPGFPKPDIYSVQDGLDPATSRPGKQVSQLTRDQFFKVAVLAINGKEYTIRDVILFEANIMGGVHAGMPKSEAEIILKTLNDQMSIGGYASSLRQLKAIGRVVLKALDPLTQNIKQKTN
ncbi:MAG: hypothetical protein A2X58_04160 [Nitrospirae bacterium GWC2_56_14]|nr:MAG: hypothetical protein A2X58_04160 [Nitrospirae bacterium GWC2_56_14]